MRVFLVLPLLLAAACGPREKMDERADARHLSEVELTQKGARPGSGSNAGLHAGVAPAPTVVFFGTSLTAGLGLSQDRAYPAVVERLARESGTLVTTVNAGLSGETSAGALRRIDWVLRTPADVYVIETGANDGLRALDVETTSRNITALIQRIRSARPEARVLLVQMEAPPNFGRAYTTRFRAMYPEIARETGAVLVPFLLEGVAAVPEMNQADGIHPNIAGAERVAANVWSALEPIIAEANSQGLR